MDDLEELLENLNSKCNDLSRIFQRAKDSLLLESSQIKEDENHNHLFRSQEDIFRAIIRQNDGALPDGFVKEVFFSILKYSPWSLDNNKIIYGKFINA